MAAAAIVNAVWDLCGQARGQAGVEAARRHAPRADRRRSSTSATSPTRSRPRRRWRCCASARPGAPSASATLRERGLPAYTTSPGWLGYDDDKLRRLVARGARRRASSTSSSRSAPTSRTTCAAARSRARRSAPGRGCASTPTRRGTCRPRSTHMERLAPFDITWIEEPTSPDDVLGHAAIARAVAPIGGRHRRARAEPRDLQAAAAAGGDRVCQIDACRLGGRQRGRRGAAAGGQVRRARLPARRRRRPVRARPAPRRVRLRRARRRAARTAWSSTSTTCTSTSSTRCVVERARYRAPERARLQLGDEAPSRSSGTCFPGGAEWSSRLRALSPAARPASARRPRGCSPTRGARVAVLDRDVDRRRAAARRRARRRDRRRRGARRRRRGGRAARRPRHPGQQRRHRRARARSRTTTTTSGAGSSTSTSSAWRASPARRCRTCASPARARSSTPPRSPPPPACRSARSTARPRARSSR